MNIPKPLAALLLWAVAVLASCGKPDTEPAIQPVPASSEPAAPEQPPAAISAPQPRQPGDEVGPICRNLGPGDRWYPQWTYCCDNADRTQSYWTGSTGFASGTWTGSCASFGIR